MSPQADPLKDKAFKTLLDTIVAEGDLLRYITKRGLCKRIAEYITAATGRKCSTDAVEDWFHGRSRPRRSPSKTLALYQFFKASLRTTPALLVELLMLCEYPNLEPLVQQDLLALPVSNRFPPRLHCFPRTTLFETFHDALATPAMRNVGVFQIGCPHRCGSSTTLLQIIQKYTGIDNARLPQPFTNIVYVDCENKIPDFSTIAFEIYQQLTDEPMPKRNRWRQELYTLLRNRNKVLLLALDNVEEIPGGSETFRLLESLGAPHLVVLASDQLVWEHPVLFPVKGLSVEEVERYAQETFPTISWKEPEVLYRFRELTGGIPTLLHWGLKSLLGDARFDQRSDMQFMSSEVHQRIRKIYTPALKRLRTHSHWNAIQQVLNALPLSGEPISADVLQRKTGLSAGAFVSAIHALHRQFLIFESEEQTYEIPYPFRWFIIPRTRILEHGLTPLARKRERAGNQGRAWLFEKDKPQTRL